MNRETRKEETERTFLDAYVRLSRRSGAQKITVAALCREADLSRGTFYLHYQDIPDFLAAAEKRIIGEFAAIRQKCHHEDSDWFPMLEHLFSYIQENAELIFTVIDESGGKVLAAIHQDVFDHMFQAWIKKCGLPPEEAHMIMDYVIAGAWAMARQWWLSGYSVDKKRAETLFNEVAKYGVYKFVRSN